MRVHAIGLQNNQGTKNKGKPNEREYNMARLIIEVPAESREGTTKEGDPYRVNGYGLDTAEVDISIDSLPTFTQLKFPCDINLISDAEMRYGRMQNIVVGYELVK